MKNYFISIQYKYTDNHEVFMTKDLIQSNSKEEALGKLLERQNYLSQDSYTLNNYNIIETDLVEPHKMDGRQWEIAKGSWENLIEVSSLTIMEGVDKYLGMCQKINAIKYLREFCKPYIGLRECKLIVEERDRECVENTLLTSLPKLIKKFGE